MTSIGITIFIAAFLVHEIFAQNTTIMPSPSTSPSISNQLPNQTQMPITTSTSAGNPDLCVDTGKKNLQDTLGRNYPQYQNLTNNLTMPMEFYRKLFNQSFTSATFTSYCSSYKTGRTDLEKCPNTTAKNLASIQLALADYVCIKKVNEYAAAIECLQNINNDVEGSQCRNNCTTYEQAMMTARNMSATPTNTERTRMMQAECQHSNCMSKCRQGTITKKCPNNSDLEVEALKVSMTISQTISETSIFPQECRDLAAMTLKNYAGVANDYLAAAINGTITFGQQAGQAGQQLAAQVGLTATSKPGGGADSMTKSGFIIFISLAMTKILF